MTDLYSSFKYLVFDRPVMDRIATAADDSTHARDGWDTAGKIYIGTLDGRMKC